MECRPTGIPGVWHGRLTAHPDERGSFMELWRASWTDGLPDTAPGGGGPAASALGGEPASALGGEPAGPAAGEPASALAGEPAVAPGARMRQANLSHSAARVLRGLHVHRRQADLWVVAEGRAFVGLVDTRPAVRGDGDPVSIGLEVAVGDALYLPEGVAHGFYAREALTLVYLVTNEYDGTDELGFAWNDPQAAVPWPDPDPIVSARDGTAPPLAELLATLRG